MELLASVIVNTTAAPPGPAPADDKPTDGYCDSTNVWFLVYIALGVVTWCGNLAVMAFAGAKPVPGRINYGRPWTVVHLLLSILVWNCLPSALGFFVFHFVVPHSAGSYMEAAARFTCTAIYGAVPFFGLFFAFQAVLLIAAYQPQQYNEVIAKLLLPAGHIDEMAANQSPAQKARFHSPTVLVYGSVSRGNVYLEVLKRMLSQYDADPDVKRRCNAPRAIMADVAKMRSFVAVNADAMEMPAGTVEVIDVGPIHVAPTADGGRTVSASDGVASEQSMPAAGPPAGNNPMQDDLYDSRLANATRSFSNAGGTVNRPPPLQLPLSNGYVDEVMIGPFLRKSPPMGDFITDAHTVRHHVQLAAEEIRRVLRPGGRVRVVDGLLETLATEADLMAVGFTIVQPTHSLHCTAGSVIGLRKPMYCCIVESVPQSAGDAERLEQQEAEIAAGLQVRNSEVLRAVPSSMFHEPNSATGSNLYDDTQTNLLAAGSPRKPDEMAVFALQMRKDHGGHGGKTRTVYHAASGPGYRVLLLCQFLMYLLLLALAASVAHPLNTPSRVPVGTRVGSLLFSVCFNYPMMAYFSRMVAASRPATVSLGAMVAGVMQTEVFSSGASMLLSGVLYVPQLGLQWGLASTSLSLSVRSYIGIAISVLIGFVAYKRGAKASTVKTLKAIDVPEDRYNQLLASG